MGTTTEAKIAFRSMTNEDIGWVRKVDEVSFADQWSVESWQDEIKHPFGVYLVMELDGKPCGYAGMWFIAREGQVTRVALAQEERGKGLGNLLIKALVITAMNMGATTMNLEVRISNLPAQKAYLAAGFKPVGARPRYYQDNHEDAIIMAQEFK